MSVLSIIVAAVLAGLAGGGWAAWEIQAWRLESKMAKIERQNSMLDQSNRDLVRKAELRYDIKVTEQVTYFTKAAKEVHHASAPLASCPVPPDAVRMLRNAASCYADPASCAVHHEVQPADGHAGRTDGAGPGGLGDGVDRNSGL